MSSNFNQKLEILLSKYFYENTANWFSCFVQIQFGVFPLFTGLLHTVKKLSDFFINSFCQNQYDFFEVHS